MQTSFMMAQVKHLYDLKMANGTSLRLLKAFHKDAMLCQYLQHLCYTISFQQCNPSLNVEQHNARQQVT
jgi:hypothetical protein